MIGIIVLIVVGVIFVPKYGLYWWYWRRQSPSSLGVEESMSTNVLEQKGFPLTILKDGERGRVIGIDTSCQGLDRQRFQDLGITSKANIERVMQGAFNGPAAYRVRNTLIALRQGQANMIRIERVNREDKK